MPFLFFGSRAVRHRLAAGEFRCPRCRARRPYALVRAQNHGHLYWVPLVKLGEPQDYVECGACRTKFEPGVLQHAAVDEAAPRGALVRAALAAMLAVARAPVPSEREREALASALARIDGPWGGDALERALARASPDVWLAAGQLAELQPTLSPSARETIMEAVLHVATADGPMSPLQADAVQQLAGALQVSSAHLKGIMLELAERRGRVRDVIGGVDGTD